MTQPEPSGCRHCGVGQRTHFSRHTDGVGRHHYEAPTQAQILARMTARRTPQQVLDALRPAPDKVITNCDGLRVWLKQMPPEPPALPNGYLTDCCPEDEPCGRHLTLAAAE